MDYLLKVKKKLGKNKKYANLDKVNTWSYCVVMLMAFLSNIFVLCGLAILASVVLYITSQKFSVKNSPEVDAIYELLPHANCGACGKAGCQDFATACAKTTKENFASLRCPVGGNKVMAKIASIRGFDTTSASRTCAVLRCNGTCQKAPDKIEYTGLRSCRVANMVMSGKSGCPNGCLRFGDCIKVCQFGALSLDRETGIPIIDYTKCTSCGACVKRCPRGLFEIRPIEDNSQVYVACRNTQKGALARKNCLSACIACGKCAKLNQEITIENNLAYIPSSVSPIEYGEKLSAECPVKAIHYRQGMIEEVEYED